MPLIPTLVKVAMPATALMVVVPSVVAPLFTVMVTEAVLFVTVLPAVSLIVMTGWVVKAEPLGAPAAGVVSVAWVAVPKIVATCTAAPLLTLLVVTIAVRLPRDGAVSKVTVNWVEVAEVTWPVPLLKVTVLLAAVVLKPVPAMVSVVALITRLLVVFKVTVGADGIVPLYSNAPMLGAVEERVTPR